MSVIFEPEYPMDSRSEESPSAKRLIDKLCLEPLWEGGYFAVTDSGLGTVPNPFQELDKLEDNTRPASNEIFYLLTPHSPQGYFHRNKARIHHMLHYGKARYVVIHAEEWQSGTYARVETFVVGQDFEADEKLQLMVEGKTYKASYLIDAGHDLKDTSSEGPGCLITEVVVPGFELKDHDFLTRDRLYELVGPEKGAELEWLIKPEDTK